MMLGQFDLWLSVRRPAGVHSFT